MAKSPEIATPMVVPIIAQTVLVDQPFIIYMDATKITTAVKIAAIIPFIPTYNSGIYIQTMQTKVNMRAYKEAKPFFPPTSISTRANRPNKTYIIPVRS